MAEGEDVVLVRQLRLDRRQRLHLPPQRRAQRRARAARFRWWREAGMGGSGEPVIADWAVRLWKGDWAA